MPVSTYGPSADYSQLWKQQAEANNAKWRGLNQPSRPGPVHRIAPPAMSANASALIRAPRRSSHSVGTALTDIFNAFTGKRQQTQQAEEAMRNAADREKKRGLWSWQLEQGLTLRQIASQSPSILGDDKFLAFAASTKPEVAEEIEQFEVVQNPLGLGGVGQRSSISGKISDWQGPAKEPETPTSLREFRMAKEAGEIPADTTLADFKLFGRTNPITNVHMRGSAPAPATGYENIFDDSGNLLRQELIEGSAAERKILADEAKAAARTQSAADRGTLVSEHAAGIRETMDESMLPTTGMIGAATSNIPGLAAHDMAKRIDTIKAIAGFQQLNEMRAQSPTGGALGQVSERELGFLQATIGSLEQSQSEGQFRENLERVERAFSTIIHGPKSGQGGPPAPTGQPTPEANSARLRSIQGLNNKELLRQSQRMATDDNYSRAEKMAVHKLGVKRGLWSDF